MPISMDAWGDETLLYSCNKNEDSEGADRDGHRGHGIQPALRFTRIRPRILARHGYAAYQPVNLSTLEELGRGRIMDGAGSWSPELLPGDLYRRLPLSDGSSEAFAHSLDDSSEFIFQASKSVRTSFLILASLNAFAGAATAAGIYWDCYQKSRSHERRLEFKPSFCKLVGPAETFPFVLSLSIAGQGITFALVQGVGLSLSRIAACESMSQILLASLLLGGGVVFYRLYRVSGPDPGQRIKAAWMVSFMAVGSLSMITTTPFFYYVSAGHGSRTSFLIQWHLSIAAMVMVNLSGIINGLVYVLLRSTKLGRIGSKAYDEFHSRRSRRRVTSAKLSSLVSAEQMGQPLSMPATLAARRVGSFERRGDIGTTARAAPPAGKYRHGAQDALAAIQPLTAEVPTRTGAYAPVDEQKSTRKSSYSLFPRNDQEDVRCRLTLPATVRGPADHLVTAPPITRFSDRKRDHVSSSSGSSATVPIGLRVSIINELGPAHPLVRTRPATASAHRRVRVPPPPMDPDVDAGSRNDKDKQLPPVPLAFTRRPPEMGSPRPQKQPPLPARVRSPRRIATGSEPDAPSPERRGHAPSASNSTLGHQPRIDEAEWI
ncbi:hypothetical protein E4U42_006784 [Claviceps africana]|uniref:Uncharacterized protein n=1 Tax=Claviceps africana TaxID=83212 RepID=A0A8K0J261_9HYPO|nr:hypothetical protein E4U42_006784 [Claviceps africana]